MIGRKKEGVTQMLDEHLKRKHEQQRLQLHQQKREELYRIEKEILPKDAIVIPRKNLKSFAFGALTVILALTFIGSAFAVFYAGTQQIISTVTTGTAPFTVASTTKVTNLNADLLDDLSSADLQDKPTSWTCTIRESTSSDCGSNCGAEATVSCSGSEKVITGGCCPGSAAQCPGFNADWNNGGTVVYSPSNSYPLGQGWYCNGYTGNGWLTALAQCCS